MGGKAKVHVVLLKSPFQIICYFELDFVLGFLFENDNLYIYCTFESQFQVICDLDTVEVCFGLSLLHF